MRGSLDDLPENWTSQYTTRSCFGSDPEERLCEKCGNPTGDPDEELCEDCYFMYFDEMPEDIEDDNEPFID